jgi:hypothetical protein
MEAESPADPARTAAILAAEQLLADEKARSSARNQQWKFGPGHPFKGIGDLIAELLGQ